MQNLAAVPSIVYGLLALAFLALLGVRRQEHRDRRSLCADSADPAGHHHRHPRGTRAVPAEIRDGSLALGATQWQTTWRQTLPSAVPGIATGTILALSRALGEAAPLLVLGASSSSRSTRTAS